MIQLLKPLSYPELRLLGVLSTILTQVFSFYFGSSQGSVDKNKTIADMKLKQ
jgi:hypothetical protein